jgi:cyclopropane fatty-acyl-phospholipid synthase-like methyltransferase
MRMKPIEKQFVNSARHSERVAEQAEQLVRVADPQAGQRLLDVGCGNGAAPIHLANTFGLDVTGVDVDPEQIALAASTDHAAARFLVADATRLHSTTTNSTPSDA